MQKIVLLGLFILPSVLFGATNIPNSHLIYAWGYGDTLNEILLAIKGLTTENDFLVNTAMAIAILIFSITRAGSDKGSPIMDIGKMFVVFAAVHFFFLKAPDDANHRFMIHDEVTSADYVVSRVPSGIGMTFALMSQFERAMLKGMEKHFSTPQSTNFSQSGLGWSLEVMKSLPNTKLAVVGPDIQSNLDLFFRNCIAIGLELKPELAAGRKTTDDLKSYYFDIIGTGSQLTVYTKQGASQLLSCTEAGKEIKKDFENVTNSAASYNQALLGMNSTQAKARYDEKFQAAASIFFKQAAGSREFLQQSMLLFATQDGIISVAKSVGLDPSVVAANTAVAEQQFFASMQAQGKLAQTYLPLAKAYLTAIIMGLSWLMALLSIMMGGWQHMKMFFTLCIWITLWTPILCIINYLNDLNLMRIAQALTKSDVALTISTNMQIFKTVSESSNFMNYLIMSTPLLAFAIAKGSEMGFVSFASSLSQAVAGSARAAGSFANQQALSTKTEISTPRGEEVVGLNAGVLSYQDSFSAGGQIFKRNSVAGGGSSISDANTGIDFKLNSNGDILSANISGLNANIIRQNLETQQENIQNSLSNAIKSGSLQSATSSAMNGNTISSTDKDLISKTTDTALAKTREEMIKLGVSEQEFDKMSAAVKGSAYAEASIGAKIPLTETGKKAGLRVEASVGGETGNMQTETTSMDWNSKTASQFRESYAKNLANEISQSEQVANTFNKAFSTSSSSEIAETRANISSYTQAKTLSSVVQAGGESQLIENYISQNNLQGTREQQVGAAAVGLQKLASENNISELSKYAGMGSGPSNTLDSAQNGSLYNPKGVLKQHNSNVDTSSGAKDFFKNTSDARGNINKDSNSFRKDTEAFNTNTDKLTNFAHKENLGGSNGDALGEIKDDLNGKVNLSGNTIAGNRGDKFNNVFNQK